MILKVPLFLYDFVIKDCHDCSLVQFNFSIVYRLIKFRLRAVPCTVCHYQFMKLLCTWVFNILVDVECAECCNKVGSSYKSVKAHL